MILYIRDDLPIKDTITHLMNDCELGDKWTVTSMKYTAREERVGYVAIGMEEITSD
jgi:hypothetical protein